MPRLIHLNGPPGIGKSTIARRYAADHHSVLDLDIDVLRSLVGGWEQDLAASNQLARTSALAMLSAHLGGGHDVVLPQLVADITQLERFEQAAADAGASVVHIVLMDDRAESVARFHRRGNDAAEAPEKWNAGEWDAGEWHDQVRSIVSNDGGSELLLRYYDGLLTVLGARPDAVVVHSIEDDVDQTYAAVLRVLSRSDDRPVS